MGLPITEPLETVLDQVLGYLNFSSGNHDPVFYSNINFLFAQTGSANDNDAGGTQEQYLDVRGQLDSRLKKLQQENGSFKNCAQATSALQITFDHLLPEYLEFHRDLLFHQSRDILFNSFFVARCLREVVTQMGHEDPSSIAPKNIVSIALSQLNDFLGHRPLATLESQKIEPYPHERVCPIPVFIKGGGVAVGKYQKIVEIAIEILCNTPDRILRCAFFNPANLTEMSIDPRAFDFDHPINRRPNYHFGQWDEDQIDQSGYFNRFILHQVTLDALLGRVERETGLATSPHHDLCEEELTFEAGALLAGTILMASGVSGDGPAAFDSHTTLGTLLPTIAHYRDEFYLDLLDKIPEQHRQRLQKEAKLRHQPFGAARQDLNAQLAERRASQLVNCRLAYTFAQMGYQQAALRQSEVVPVASARILCQIDCLLSSANSTLLVPMEGPTDSPPATDSPAPKQGLDSALDSIKRAIELLKRGIHCGAIVDPWNIIGFDANYSLFPATENSVRDHRAYDLVELVEKIMAIFSKLWSEAAARDCLELCQKIKTEFRQITNWWRKYAAHEVMSVEAVDADDIFDAAHLVARALNLWHKGGAETGNIRFWSEHAGLFDSPKAYSLVTDALMQRGDYATAVGLLVHWLEQSDRIPLQQGDSSFHDLMFRWITEQKQLLRVEAEEVAAEDRVLPEEIWSRIRRFYELVEANAHYYWDVPDFRMGRSANASPTVPTFEDPFEEEPESDIFAAAYEKVTYSDTTDDGVEGNIFESGAPSDDALEAEVDRVLDRLEFLETLASYWRVAASIPLPVLGVKNQSSKVCERLKHRREIILVWVKQAIRNRRQLTDLLESVHQFPLPQSGTDPDSMIQYDRNRLYKESLLDRTISTCVETENAIRMLLSVVRATNHLIDKKPLDQSQPCENGGTQLITVFAAVMLKDPDQLIKHFPAVLQFLADQSLLYVPLSKGGDPSLIVAARVIQSAMLELLGSLPSLALFQQSFELTQTALKMERNHPIGAGAVTEFDALFEVSYTSMVHCLVQASDRLHDDLKQDPAASPKEIKHQSENILFDCIEMLTESMLVLWLDHSRTLRLSVVEKVFDEKYWGRLVEFIKEYGEGLLTQQFLHLANIRAILHQGVDNWLYSFQESVDAPDLRLLDELGHRLPREKAVRYLTLILEAIIENYSQYRDYNTTTTQSDDGRQLHILLDFLRLRTRYERVCWNLKPVIWAHEILVRDQQNNVARMWRRSLTDRVGPEAEKYLNMFAKLREKYSVRMTSIQRRLLERFGHPVQIDRLRALVAPAMQNPNERKSSRAFDLLQQDAQNFLKSAVGAGMDLPNWLVALENEVEQNFLPERQREHQFHKNLADISEVSISELRLQLEGLPFQKRNKDEEVDE